MLARTPRTIRQLLVAAICNPSEPEVVLPQYTGVRGCGSWFTRMEQWQVCRLVCLNITFSRDTDRLGNRCIDPGATTMTIAQLPTPAGTECVAGSQSTRTYRLSRIQFGHLGSSRERYFFNTAAGNQEPYPPPRAHTA